MIVGPTIDRWPHQLLVQQEVPRILLAGESRKLLVTSPTGGGKGQMICDLIEFALDQGWYSILHTNRRLLINQLCRVLSARGIEYGVRAAGHRDERELPVQISSLPTENARVLKSEKWQVHGHGTGRKVLALVDECHINSGEVAQKILNRYVDNGGFYVGMTATPIDLGHLYDKLLVAGKPSDLRKCGALVPAFHFGPDEPDMTKFKPSQKTGEFTEKDVVKAIMTKTIFARVLDQYRILNPEQRPTLLFAPGVKESIWFAEQLHAAGIRTAHIDGEGVWLDGRYRTDADRNEILDMVRGGDIKILTNRFVLREGLDLPEVSHLIFATVIGSLQSYLQAGGRGLRKCEGKDRCTIQDHGGLWWRHGSINQDRDWLLEYTENIIAGMRADRFREHKVPEPIRCAQCGQIRVGGIVCSACGYESPKKTRMVVQVDGRLKEHTGDIFKPRVVKNYANTAELWERTYYRARRSRNRMTFRQAEGLFFYENHYYPPRDSSAFMPVNDIDWSRAVVDVPPERLT